LTAAALGIVRSLLAPEGSLSLIGQQPGWDAVAARAFAAWLGDVLGTQGFAVDEVLVGDIEPSPAVCVRARPASRRGFLAWRSRCVAGGDSI
jgi:hypothetical protein